MVQDMCASSLMHIKAFTSNCVHQMEVILQQDPFTAFTAAEWRRPSTAKLCIYGIQNAV